MIKIQILGKKMRGAFRMLSKGELASLGRMIRSVMARKGVNGSIAIKGQALILTNLRQAGRSFNEEGFAEVLNWWFRTDTDGLAVRIIKGDKLVAKIQGGWG
jgi:hypothetical protein